MEYILVLPSWYPSKLDNFRGDFNERLVNSVAILNTQVVVFVSTLRNSKIKDIEVFEEENIITYKAYFAHSKYDLINVYRLIKLYLSIFKIVFKKYGLPKLVHNYVFFPSGIISVYLKYRYNLKLVLTEHWSLFNYKNNVNHIYTQSIYKRRLYSKILKSFDSIISVSKSLEVSISEWTPISKKYILPNVVNVTFFNKKKHTEPNSPFTFIHVSDTGPHKNVLGILNVFKNLIGNGVAVNLILIGKEKEEISAFIKNNFLNENIKLLGELPYQEVADAMRVSDAFVLFSNYENMPCVILEALCCGLPVISSNVGGVSTVLDKTNGLLIEPSNEEQLENAIIQMMENYNQFDISQISAKAIELYNYDNIGKLTNKIYLETLK
ncbi:glycosyltransferase [Pedobacter alpinus]|uniref:Glycosyltransferase n=1 Tax=Pedobacter alpinus TaxID=1590643 RepID=A0ABW5TV67_9SPHI